MAKTALKQHNKIKYETGVYASDGTFYTTGQRGDVELRLVYSTTGKKRGMYWCHKTKAFNWRKAFNDEIRKEIKKK